MTQVTVRHLSYIFLSTLLVYIWYWTDMLVFISKLNYVYTQAKPLKPFPNSTIFTTFLWGKPVHLFLPSRIGAQINQRLKHPCTKVFKRIICLSSLPISNQAVCFCYWVICFCIFLFFHTRPIFSLLCTSFIGCC